jgi:hypothetical protein
MSNGSSGEAKSSVKGNSITRYDALLFPISDSSRAMKKGDVFISLDSLTLSGNLRYNDGTESRIYPLPHFSFPTVLRYKGAVFVNPGMAGE